MARTLRLGAAVTYAELERAPLAGLAPALAQAARTVGSPQIRNAATIGGNLATCSPAGDGLPVLAALDAVVELRGPDGTRTLPVLEFMTGVKRTALRPSELIVAVTVPVLDGWQGYAKVGVRNAMVIAIAGACLAVDRPGRSVRLALGSVAPTIVRAADAEAHAVATVDWDTDAVTEQDANRFGELAAAATSPIDDHRATAAYRRRAVEVLVPTPAAAGVPERIVVSANYKLHVNGRTHDVADAWVGESLLYVLRERLGLMGSKGACEQGECGSCSVLVDGDLVCSCLVLAASAVDRPIVTVEGLGRAGRADGPAARLRRCRAPCSVASARRG